MKEIFIKKDEHISKIVLIENGNVIEKYEDNDKKKRLEGKIYLGTVQNVLQGMQAAFIDIGEEKNTFIHLKDILPKVNVVKNNNVQEEKNIKKLVKQGDRILIQVKRDATSMKGAKVSTHISIPSRYFVLMPNTDIMTISQKIENEEERKRLSEIVNNILPENFGVIIRTSSLNRKSEELQKDLKSAIKIWKDIENEMKNEDINVPKVVYKGQTFIEKLLVDLASKDIERIVVNDKNIFEEVKRIIKQLEETEINVEFKENENIFKTYDIEEQLEKSEQRKVWLRCGRLYYNRQNRSVDCNRCKFREIYRK